MKITEELLLLTFADKMLDEQNRLRKSCEQFKIPWKVIISSPWKENVYRLKLLRDFVENQNPDLVVLVVDAYDVIIYNDAETILKAFMENKADVVFSGESNYSFRDSRRWITYLMKYPLQSTIYQYLNAGTYMGKSKHLLQMLDTMQQELKIDFQDEVKLLPIKSDQYLLSKFFVKNYYKQTNLKLALDANHTLFGCTGGRLCVLKFPDFGKSQAFANFLIERSLLLLFSLERYQQRPKDYKFNKNRFFNKKTKSFPPIIHLPGSSKRFGYIIENLSQENPKFSKNNKWILAAGISLFAFIVSFLAGPLFWLITRRFK